MLFDGSDVGISGLAIDALDMVSPTELLLSFASAGSVPGLGTVASQDIVRFTASSLGATTAGSFDLYFDGSDIGLSSGGENIDAVSQLPGGDLLISTTGTMFAQTGGFGFFFAPDEDIVRFTPSSLGPSTSGSLSAYIDGSDVGLTSTDEDVNAASTSNGDLLLSTEGAFSVPGVSGANEDVMRFTPTSTGATTSGTFDPTLVLDGSAAGLGPTNVVAVDAG